MIARAAHPFNTEVRTPYSQNTAKQNPGWENLIALRTCDVVAVVTSAYVANTACQTPRYPFSVVALKAFEAGCAIRILVAVALTDLHFFLGTDS